MTQISRKVNGRILFSLSMFVMLFIVLSFISIQQLRENEEFRLSDETIETIDLNIRDLFRTDVDFFNFDLINPEFFTMGNTHTRILHDSLLTETTKLIAQVRENPEQQVSESLTTVEKGLKSYDSLFRIIVEKLRHKGFKDHGLEGQLRGFAHALENKNLISMNEILMLRRHEKDYLLRDDVRYVEQFNTLAETLAGRYKKSPEALALINNYAESFNQLVSVNKEIGMHQQSGIKGELNRQTGGLLNALAALNREGEMQTAKNHAETYRMFIIVSLFAVVFCGVLIFVTARHL